MNRSEKIHFTKDYAGKKNVLYLDLYKAYQKSDCYEKDQIEKSVRKKWSDKNLRQATIYLESAVVSSLAMSVKDDELRTLIDEAEKELKVFRSKGLFIEYFKSNEKLVELNKDTPKILDYADYLSTAVFYNITKQKSSLDEPYYKEFLNIIEEIPIYFKGILHYLQAHRKLMVSGDILKGESKDVYYKIIKEIDELIKVATHPATKIYLGQSKFVYACIINDKEIAFESAFYNIEIYESNEKFKIINESKYFARYLALLILIEHHEEPLRMATEIRSKVRRIKNENQEIKLMNFCADMIHLKVSLNNNEIKEHESQILILEATYQNSILPWPRDLRAYILSLFVAINFILENYEKSLEWIEIFEDQNYKDFRQDLCINVKFLTILNHYELGNTLLLPYYIKHTYRFISKRKSLSAQESWILSALKKISKFGFKDSLIRDLKSDYEEKLNSDKFFDNKILSMSVWLESKLQDESYLEVLEGEGIKKALA